MTWKGWINDLLLCRKSDSARFHKRKCIYGHCENCCNYENTLRAYYSDLINLQLSGTWHHWELVTEKNRQKKKRLVTKRQSISQMIEELILDVKQPVQNTSFAKHLFQARWQQPQFCQLKNNVPEGHVLMGDGPWQKPSNPPPECC